MGKYIFAFLIFISSSTFLFAQTENAAVSTNTPVNSKSSKKVKILAKILRKYSHLIEDHDNEMAKLLQTFDINPGYISRSYSNEAEISDEAEIEYLLKNIKSENGATKPLEKYTGYDIYRIYFIIYKYFGEGSHIKVFLFTPEGVIFERLFSTDAHNHIENAVNFITNESVYITEKEAWIFTQG